MDTGKISSGPGQGLKLPSGTNVIIYILGISAILYIGRTLLIPLAFSALIACILYPLCKWLENRGVKRSLAIAAGILLVFVLLTVLLLVLIHQISEFSKEWTVLQQKLSFALNELSLFLSERLGILADQQVRMVKNFVDSSGEKAIPIITGTANSLTQVFLLLFLMPILSSLILYHRGMLVQALYGLFPQERRKEIHDILRESIHAYFNFIKGMVLVYLIVGILNSIGLYFIGIPQPVLFGFTASILTFIPYVGIMIAALLPMTVSWITYDSIWYPVYVAGVFTVVQLLEANIIFPFAVGSRLKINSLAIIITIILGGIVWGGAGMILFIPMLSIMKLIADRTPGLETLATLLGSGENESKKQS